MKCFPELMAVTKLEGVPWVLPTLLLITIYKTFIKPHIDYGDVAFGQASNNSFHQRLEPIQ